MKIIKRILYQETGLEISDYAISGALIVAATVVASTLFGQTLAEKLGPVCNTLLGLIVTGDGK